MVQKEANSAEVRVEYRMKMKPHVKEWHSKIGEKIQRNGAEAEQETPGQQ